MSKQPPPPFFILRGHEGAISTLHFTDQLCDITSRPALLSGSETGEIRIWNLQTFRTTHQFKGHDGRTILFLYYYKSALLSHGRDNYFNVWDFQNQQWTIIRQFSSPSVGFCPALFCVFNESAYVLMYDDSENVFKLYDYEENSKQKYLKIEGQTGICMCLKVITVGNNQYLISGYESGHIGLWCTKSGSEVSREHIHSEPIMCLDFDDKHRHKGISGSVDSSLEIWTISEELKILKKQTVTMSKDGISAVKIRDDGKIVITSSQDVNIRVYSWKTLKLLAVLNFHELPIRSLEFCSETVGKITSVFASGSKDKRIALWSLY